MNNKELQAIIEGLLFISGDDGLDLPAIQEVLPNEKPSVINKVIDQLLQKYQKDEASAFSIQKFHKNKFRLQTKPIFHDYLAKLNFNDERRRLSNSVVEVLSIVLYRGPIAKGAIDDLRNCDSTYQLQKLREQKLVEIAGKSEENPRANTYQITDNFFKVFNLNSREDIPKLDFEEIKNSQELMTETEEKTVTLKGLFSGE
jgi:segregation and condensation protein B